VTDHLTYPQQISIPYTYTAGPAHRAFLRGLAAGRLLGSRWGDEVLVPARPFAPDGSRTGDLVEVGPGGRLEGWTVAHRAGSTTVYGLIRLDGATSTMLHVLDVPADALEAGLRVQPRWAATPAAEITAIEAFVLAAE